MSAGHFCKRPIKWNNGTIVIDTAGNDRRPLVLFGSQARGEAGEHSDYDVALFLRGAVACAAKCTGPQTSALAFSTLGVHS